MPLEANISSVSRHQANHARIQSLRSTSSTLDDQIKSTLTLLNDTRTELLATPATVFPENTSPVYYSELLSYARRISKFTIPPTFREADTDGAAPETTNMSQDSEVKNETQIELHDSKTNGTSTPVVTNGAIGGFNSGEAGTATPIDAENPTALPAVVSDWLNPLAGSAAFVPWPTEETIRRGALASIQVLLDTGVDPATFDPERSAELEAERKRREEEAEALKAQQEAEKARLEQERREELQRRQSVSTSLMAAGPGSARAEEKPAVFTGLDILDDMDEDED
jgi:hypothetical protein